MTDLEHTPTEAAEARISGFDSHLELMLMGLRIMRENGQPAEQIADRPAAAWQQIGVALAGRVQ